MLISLKKKKSKYKNKIKKMVTSIWGKKIEFFFSNDPRDEFDLKKKSCEIFFKIKSAFNYLIGLKLKPMKI